MLTFCSYVLNDHRIIGYYHPSLVLICWPRFNRSHRREPKFEQIRCQLFTRQHTDVLVDTFISALRLEGRTVWIQFWPKIALPLKIQCSPNCSIVCFMQLQFVSAICTACLNPVDRTSGSPDGGYDWDESVWFSRGYDVFVLFCKNKFKLLAAKSTIHNLIWNVWKPIPSLAGETPTSSLLPNWPVFTNTLIGQNDADDLSFCLMYVPYLFLICI